MNLSFSCVIITVTLTTIGNIIIIIITITNILDKYLVFSQQLLFNVFLNFYNIFNKKYNYTYNYTDGNSG